MSRRRSPRHSFGPSGLAALLGIGGGVLLSRAFLRRVDAIARTAEAIIGGDLARRVPVRGTGDDLDRLAGTLNRMLDRIDVLMESLRQVSSDVAHDLRTPLSRLYPAARGRAGTCALRGGLRGGGRARDRRGAGTAGNILRAAADRAGGGRIAARRVPRCRPRARGGDRSPTPTGPTRRTRATLSTAIVRAGVIVHGDQELLTQALANLVENALRHTPAGTRIERPSSGSADSGRAASRSRITGRAWRRPTCRA